MNCETEMARLYEESERKQGKEPSRDCVDLMRACGRAMDEAIKLALTGEKK